MSHFEKGNYLFSAKTGPSSFFIILENLESPGISVLQRGSLCFWLRDDATREDARKLESLLNDLVQSLTYQID